MGSGWRVHKLGGSSLAGKERYRAAVRLLESEKDPKQGVVVSAMGGVTDRLIALMTQASSGGGGKTSWIALLDTLVEEHIKTAREICEKNPDRPELKSFEAKLASDRKDLHDLLHAAALSRSASSEISELVQGYGELWSAPLLTLAFIEAGLEAVALDARDVLRVSDGEFAPIVNWEASGRLLKEWLSHQKSKRVVITGFVARNEKEIAVTLKRNGSDYSATIFAALFEADQVTLWKEVDGILSADPRSVPDAQVLSEISYSEASELAYFGAKILHPSSMAPAIASQIPIRIRNTFAPEKPGTLISVNSGSQFPVKGFTSIKQVALVNVEGTGMMGVPGVAHRVFGALKEVGVSVILISQASSEHSICLAVPEDQGQKAKTRLETEFEKEIKQRQIERVELLLGLSILAVVGDRMVEQKGIAARFFRDLSRAGVNIRAIAQGSSERNISVVIESKDSAKALRAAHSGFDLSKNVVSLAMVGLGQIGTSLLNQIKERVEFLSQELHVDLRLRAVVHSKGMHLDESGRGFPVKDWSQFQSTEYRAKGKKLNWDELGAFLKSESFPHSVVIDCTASDEVADFHPKWMESGLHVITASKLALSGPLSRFNAIQKERRAHKVQYAFEATVGAGLPIFTTLKDFVQTGDRVTKIEGVLSGTLSYIFNQLQSGETFEATVKKAKELGLTEPDPKEDLSGKDVARKLTILARELGASIETSQVKVESLANESDATMGAKLKQAADQGKVLKYVATLHPRETSLSKMASVSVESLDPSHPIAQLKGSDNMIVFWTDRYQERPLVIQGPGAGKEVTAAGVFSDLLRLLSVLNGGLS